MSEQSNISQHKTFPLTYTGWDEAGGNYGEMVIYDVTFTEDFGPIKSGTKFDYCFINVSNIQCGFNNEDECTFKIKYKCVPC